MAVSHSDNNKRAPMEKNWNLCNLTAVIQQKANSILYWHKIYLFSNNWFSKADSLCYQECSHVLQSSILAQIKTFSWCFGYCWTVFAQYQGFFSFLLLISSCSWQDGTGQKSGRKMARTAQPNYAKGCFMLSGVMSSNRKGLSKKCLPVGVFPHTAIAWRLAAHWAACERCDWLLLQQQGFFPSSLTKLSLSWPAGLPTFVIPVLSLVLLGCWWASPGWVSPPQQFPWTDQELPAYFSSFLTTSPANKETYP